MNVKPFSDEIYELQVYLDVHYYHLLTDEPGAKVNELYQKLARVNRELWKIEDEVRLRVNENPLNKDRLVEIALLIPKLNDQRADLVQQINVVFQQVPQPEKIYIGMPTIGM
jgi:hypothetical protein